jgi:hypothetical protein
LPLILTDRTRKNGLGPIEKDKMLTTINLVAKFQRVDSSITATDMYTAEF